MKEKGQTLAERVVIKKLEEKVDFREAISSENA